MESTKSVFTKGKSSSKNRNINIILLKHRVKFKFNNSLEKTIPGGYISYKYCILYSLKIPNSCRFSLLFYRIKEPQIIIVERHQNHINVF